MQPLRAKVHNGRLVLDEPTDLPEGEVVELVRVDDVLGGGGDSLDDEEREQLHESIRESIEQMKAGNLIDADVRDDEVVVLSVWGARRASGPKL